MGSLDGPRLVRFRLIRSPDRSRSGPRETKVFPRPHMRNAKSGKRLTMQSMERKIFWGSMTVLGILADLVLPLWWAVGATIPIIYFSWWIAYRSGWFE